MKRIIVLACALVLVASLAGCGNSGANATGQASSGSRVTLNENYADALPVSSQLAIGTLLLEDTENAVTAEQAGELLPYWQMFQALQSSGTAAQPELDATLTQIQAAMTDEQLAAIKAMQLTLDNMTQLMQERGLARGFGGAAGDASRGGFGGIMVRPEGGGFVPPEGGPGGAIVVGPGGFGGSGAPGSDQQQATTADRINRLTGTVMTGALISMLQARAAGQTWQAAAPNQDFALQRALFAAVIEATGLDQQALMTQVAEGTTLAEIVEANGADLEAVVAQVVASETERVNQAVADGSMAQADADQWLADLETRVRDSLEHPLQFGGRGAPGGFSTPDTTPATTTPDSSGEAPASGAPQGASAPAATAGVAATPTPPPAGTDTTGETSQPTPTESAATDENKPETEAPAPTEEAQATSVETAQETAPAADSAPEVNAPVATPAPVLASQPAAAIRENPAAASAVPTVNLERIPDPDPAPPLTILVSAIQIKPNGYYKVTGTIRNDSAEVYGGPGVVATFYEASKPCSEREVTRRGRDGSEQTVVEEVCDYNWHGPVEAYAVCSLLAPGAECPFSLEIYPEDYVSYMLHAEGAPVAYRQPATVALNNVSVTNNGLGTLRITGTATNGNPFAVRDTKVAATLFNAAGQIVSVGAITVPGEIAPGASMSFDLRVEYTPYSNYQLTAQATQT